MKAIRKYLSILVGLALSVSVFSQNQRFEVGMIAGLNFSALVGEELTDYAGINVGIMSIARLSKKYNIGIEFLFSQNGEYLIPEFYPKVEYSQLRLNHLEIPIHINRIVSTSKNGRQQTATFNLGIAYIHLLNYKAKDIEQKDISNQIIYNKRSALMPQAGMIYHFSKNLGLNLKATIPVNVEDWTLAIRMIYTL